MSGWKDFMSEAPSIVVLWDKKPVARQAHLCDFCNDEIPAGQQYESRGFREDGEFKSEKIHLHAYRYPSGCPRHRLRDLADENRDFAQAFPSAPSTTGEQDEGGAK